MILRTTPIHRLLIVLAAATPMIAPGAAGEIATAAPRPGPAVLEVDRFVTESGPVCLHERAAACVDVGWAFADRNEDQGLSVVELVEVRDELRAWAQWRADDLYPTERSLLVLGFVVVEGVGIERLHALYDTDADGLVDRDELLADVRLDERPLGEVLLDPEAVDRAAIAARLGLPPALLERLQP